MTPEQKYNWVIQKEKFEVWDYVLKRKWMLIHDDEWIPAIVISKIENDWNIRLMYMVGGRMKDFTIFYYKCRHCWKEFERDQLIKRSFCEKYQKKTNLIRLIK